MINLTKNTGKIAFFVLSSVFLTAGTAFMQEKGKKSIEKKSILPQESAIPASIDNAPFSAKALSMQKIVADDRQKKLSQLKTSPAQITRVKNISVPAASNASQPKSSKPSSSKVATGGSSQNSSSSSSVASSSAPKTTASVSQPASTPAPAPKPAPAPAPKPAATTKTS
jgi:hypothetical protein